MVGEREHQVAVSGWLERVAGGSTQEVIRAFEAAFAALWERTSLTLGEVTLVALVERVLGTAIERHPWLASIETTTSGVRCQRLETQEGLRHGDVCDAIGFVVTEFLTVLGNLTAQILTPALHAELSKDHPTAVDRVTKEDVP